MVSGFYSQQQQQQSTTIYKGNTQSSKRETFFCVDFPTKTCQRAKPDPNTWRFNFNPLWNVICHIIKTQTSMVAEEVLHSFIKCEDEIDT